MAGAAAAGAPAPELAAALALGATQPWFEPYRAVAGHVARALDAGQPLPSALNAVLARQAAVRLPAGPLRFVDATALPLGMAYESFIWQTATVPTRGNVHDLFNALVWLRFPRLKARLNELQAADIAQRGAGTQRGPLRDALTLFDENGALWSAPPALAAALAERDWAGLFVAERAQWPGRRPLLVGHALLEKLLQPRKGITAHAWLLPAEPPPPDLDAMADAALAVLRPDASTAAARQPLPVLGVPGWWAANGAPGFYDDAAVFRPLRR